MLRLVLTPILLLALTAPALATASPQQLLEQKTAEVVRSLEEHSDAIREDARRAYELIDDLLMPIVDMPRIARFVLGRHWRQATPEQRARFTEEFHGLLLRTYGAALREYIDEAVHQAREAQFTYQTAREGENDEEVTVRSTIRTPEGARYVVLYRMHQRDGDWKIYDIVLEGVSLVNSYRSSISSDVSRLGLDGVIDQLAERNRDLPRGG